MASGGPRSSREALSRRDYEEVRFVGVARLSAVLIVLQLMDLIHLPPPPPFECHSAQRCGIRSTSSRSSSRPPGMVGALVAASAMRHDRGSNQSVTGSHSYSIMSFSLTASTTSSGNTSASESFFTHSNVASATRSTSAAGTMPRPPRRHPGPPRELLTPRRDCPRRCGSPRPGRSLPRRCRRRHGPPHFLRR